jgi:hypothetical protein
VTNEERTARVSGPVEAENDIGTSLETIGTPLAPLQVRLSKELITLLSEQLYTSPSKAIEELVVNSFDADASSCWVFVPSVTPGTEAGDLEVIAVLDNGVGMDVAGLSDLWRVGSSTKRTEQVERQRKRKQIGKFGIGKLATYSLASQITYVTSSGDGQILSVSLSFDAFRSASDHEADAPVTLQLTEVSQDQLVSLETVQLIMASNNLDPETALSADESWTLVLLEKFKPKAVKLTTGRLRWVLSTAMPISDFQLFLNGDPVESSKATHSVVAQLEVADLPPSRLERLKQKTGVAWSRQSIKETSGNERKALVSSLLPNGVSGTAFVSDKTIYGGKSRDLIRSHGFFVRVRGRLIAEDDPLFGSSPLSYEVFNRFRADVEADDLDEDITAPRESAINSERVSALQDVLAEVFYEVRGEFERKEKERFKQETKREDERNYVYPHFVERPIADALLRSDEDEQHGDSSGADADDTWFYLIRPSSENVATLASELYSATSRLPYSYRIEEGSREDRLVQFDPESRAFVVNSQHELALAFKDNPVARDLLYDLATAETLLEVYLREVGLEPSLVGEVLERRDGLFRSLAQEQLNSPASIASALRNASNSERDLEIALVVSARALGFVAKHIGNGGRADGVARFSDYARGQRKITLEAKSSASVPSLSAIDFAGLEQHMRDESAEACMLVAPAYPGSTRGEDAAAAQRAINARVSCWTVEQLALVVEALETRDITARSVLDIVLTKFAPDDVTSAVSELLSDPANAPRELAREILKALRSLEHVYPDRVRSTDMVAAVLGTSGVSVSSQVLENTMAQLASASGGALTAAREGRFILNTSIEELERRTGSWASNDSPSRRASTFREADGHHHNKPDTSDVG